MNMKNSAKDIYAALKATEAALDAGDVAAAKAACATLHTALNEARKGFFPHWPEFLAYIGEDNVAAGQAALVGGSGGKDNDPPGGGE